MTEKLEINPIHDPESLNRTLQQNSRLQVHGFFTPETAEYLYRLLVDNQHWYLAYNNGDNYYESSMEQLNALNPDQRQKFMNSIYHRARTQFQYVFNQYYITQAIELNENPGAPIHRMHDFMNSDEMLEFMRKLTGDMAIKKADSYATTYLPGHFLTAHDDRHAKHDRSAAYVFSMTKTWEKNWGGHLAFFDDAGNIREAFIPSFNTLKIFLIPQMHSVQLVTPFAGAKRTSYLGWLHR
jgi:Rps23 Pro-64 3,4-dihydroxylase Tpa1-like proline 4-hydroxylase